MRGHDGDAEQTQRPTPIGKVTAVLVAAKFPCHLSEQPALVRRNGISNDPSLQIIANFISGKISPDRVLARSPSGKCSPAMRELTGRKPRGGIGSSCRTLRSTSAADPLTMWRSSGQHRIENRTERIHVAGFIGCPNCRRPVQDSCSWEFPKLARCASAACPYVATLPVQNRSASGVHLRTSIRFPASDRDARFRHDGHNRPLWKSRLPMMHNSENQVRLRSINA